MDLRAPAGRISSSGGLWWRDGRLLEWLCLLGVVLFASDARPIYASAADAPVAHAAADGRGADVVDAAPMVARTDREVAGAPLAVAGATMVSDPRAQVQQAAAQPTGSPAPEPTVASTPTHAPARVQVAAPEPTTVAPASMPAPAPMATAPPPAPTAVVAAALSNREQRLLDAMNAQRIAASLPPLRPAGALTAAARARSQDMTAGGYFAHVSPRGETWMTLLNGAGWSFAAGGENLAMVGGDEAQSVAVAIEKLMASPTHRSNILNPAFRLAGVGAVVSASGVTIFATIFTDR
jgi:uncharacterized protein YkwD